MRIEHTLTALLLSVTLAATAQVSVHDGSGTNPDNSSMFDIQSGSKGALMPRVALTGVNDASTVASPAASLLVYNTSSAGGLSPGYYYNSGTSGSPVWMRLMSGNTTPLTGSGTAYQVAYWSGANALTGSTSFTYGATGNLTVFNAEATGGEVRLGAAWGRPGLYSSQRLEIQSGSTGILFGNANVEYMRMTATGNVGIGNSAPNVKLNVGEAIPAGHQYVYLRSYGNEPGSWKGGAAFGYTSASVIIGQLSNVATIGGHAANLNAWADLAINPAGTGNVGVGLSNPGAKLTVRSGATDPSTYDDGKTLFASGAFGAGQTYDGGVEFRHDNLSQGIGFGYNTIYQTGTNPNEILNLIARGTGAITLNAYGGATGNVGIGTTTPLGKLDVRVPGSGTWDRFVVKTTSFWGDGTVAPSETAGAQYVTIGAGGAAGIMIYNPHIVWNGGNNAAAIRFGRGGGISTGEWWEAGVNATSGFHIRKNAAVSTGIEILNDGRIGIGKSAPSSKVEILHNTSLANGMYDASNIEVATNNASNPSIGFHREGHTATALYHAGYGNNSLRIRNADGLDAALLHDQSGIQNQYTGAQSANFWISGTGRADGVFRAPWFTVTDYSGGLPGGDGSFYRTGGQAELGFDDWMYMRDVNDNAIRLQFYMDNGGQIIYGPNTGWGRYLRVGGNANQTDEANIAATDGNLHIDNRAGHAIYLNHYVNNWVRHGNGATGYIINGNFEYFDNDDWIYNRYAPNNRVFFENRLGIRGTIGIGGNPWGWTDARCSDCADAITGNPNLWLTAQDRVYFAARNTNEAYEFTMETPGVGTHDKAVVPQFANWGRLGTPARWWYITYSGHFRYKHYWDDYEGFDTYDDLAELRAIKMDTVWDPILNHHVGKIKGETIPKFLTNYEDKEGAGDFIDVRRMDGFLLGVSRQIDRETVERDERLTARTEVLAKALGVDFSVPNQQKIKVRVQDMGSASGQGEVIDVRFEKDFSQQTAGAMPNVSVTPTAPYVAFHVSRKDSKGFSVNVKKEQGQAVFSFDWTASADASVSAAVNGKEITSTDDVFYRKPIGVTGKDHPVSNHSKKRDISDEERGMRVTDQERLRAEQVSKEHIEEMNRNANVPPHGAVPPTPAGIENNMPADPKGRSTPSEEGMRSKDAVLPERQSPTKGR